MCRVWASGCGVKVNAYLSSILRELKVNLWDHIGILVPQKG